MELSACIDSLTISSSGIVCINPSIFVLFLVLLFHFRFSTEDVSAQNQVKASVQRKIRQSIAEEVSTS